MKNTLNRILPTILLAGGLYIFQSCDDAVKETDSKEVAEDKNEAKFDKLNEKDAEKVVDAYTSNLYEIKLAEAVQAKATSGETKSLAEMLKESHSTLNNQLKELAAKKQISLPSEITSAQREKINDFNEEKSKELDEDYAELMVSKHKDAIRTYEDCANNCTDQDIRSWFASAVPELRKHLDMAMNTEQKIKSIKK